MLKGKDWAGILLVFMNDRIILNQEGESKRVLSAIE